MKYYLFTLFIHAYAPDCAIVSGFHSPSYSMFSTSRLPYTPTSTSRFVLELDKVETEGILENEANKKNKKGSLHIKGSNDVAETVSKYETLTNVEILDPSTYEAMLINSWDGNPTTQKGFDWEIEKIRRNFAGLQQLEDGTWVRRPSLFDFLISRSRLSTAEVRRFDEAPKPVTLYDVVILFATNFLANIGFGPTLGMASVPDAVIQKYEGSFFSFIKGALGGDLQTLAGGPLFLLLAKYYTDYGPIFNLSFGPKSFLVISDPVMARHILRESRPDQYCKGMLAEILEPIMGQGLIPADPATWKVRRRVLAPGFHKRWLTRMIDLFGDCGERLISDLEVKAKSKENVDMEERFCSVTLDIIGKSVFNFDFGSTTKESRVVKAVYRVLREAEHRSSSFIPYWNLPYADKWMGGQVEFRKDMTMLDDILADLINRAVSSRQEATVEELEERDNAEDPSLLRFLCDMRGEDLNSKVLRDDLMTMLIAGHETTAAMLTWTLFELSKGDPELLKEVQDEVRTVLNGKVKPDYDDIVAMKKLRLSLIEALRLYPEPPILIRRARIEDTLPPGGTDLRTGVKVLRGTDIFISTWNLHRSPELWENSEKYDPTRWERPWKNMGVTGWEGYNPEKITGLYPNEAAADFAFLPFGGGARRCVGDQFAMMEACVTMAMLVNKYDFKFTTGPEDVGMRTGATIHTMNGLNMIVSKSEGIPNTTGYWEREHLKRGFSATGMPHKETI